MSEANITTNLTGRLRNTHLPKTHGLLPFFEAVVNSIHAIEEAGLTPLKGRIVAEILRRPQGQLALDDGKGKRGPVPVEDITGFRIRDNGVGFDDANMRSFQTLDSEHKLEKGCRGVGRLLWLRAFERVVVDSVYADAKSCLLTRKFEFSAARGVSEPTEAAAPSGTPRETSVHLDGFGAAYREASRKTVTTIADNLLEHCLWYFVREGGAPEIVVVDGDERIDLHRVYEQHMHSSAVPESVTIAGYRVDLTHVRLRSGSLQSHTMALCAGNRLVQQESLNGKIPGLFGKIRDETGESIYVCYVCSQFLDENVRSERTGFDLLEESGPLLDGTTLTLASLRAVVLERARVQLAGHLEVNRQAGQARLQAFVATKAPRYRPIVARLTEDERCVDPAISDKELDLLLHKRLAQAEAELLEQGHNLMVPLETEDPADYEKRLAKYLAAAEEIKKSDLANYVAHRRVVLDLLTAALKRRADGKYSREELIHRLIMPMRKTSDEIAFDSCNLWLVDERLAFHDYLASDKPLASMPITKSDSPKEPDLLALSVVDNPVLVSEASQPPLASLVVVEIKRPMRDTAGAGEDKDPIEQALGYVRRVRDGKVRTQAGRPIPKADAIPAFCYVLCDLTPTVEERCLLHGLRVTHDHMGYFGYNDNYRAYIEVISFDKLVRSATERNRAFFDKLGLPAT